MVFRPAHSNLSAPLSAPWPQYRRYALRKCIPVQDFQGHRSYPVTPSPPPSDPFNLVEINHEGGEAEGDGFAAVNSGEDGVDYPNLGLLCRHKAAH